MWRLPLCVPQNVTTNNGPNVQRNQETKQKLNIENTVSQLQSDVASLRQCLTELQVSCASGFQRTDNSIVMSSTPQANLNQREILSPILNESTELQMGSRAKPKSSGDRKYWVFLQELQNMFPLMPCAKWYLMHCKRMVHPMLSNWCPDGAITKICATFPSKLALIGCTRKKPKCNLHGLRDCCFESSWAENPTTGSRESTAFLKLNTVNLFEFVVLLVNFKCCKHL